MALSQEDFDFVRGFVQKRSAIVLEKEKAYLAETRLALVARREGLASVDDLVAQLRLSAPNGLHQKVVEAMTINETSFFRDLKPFDALRQRVLPELLQRRAGDRRLSIWCAASSTGQEPYSLAMLVREHFPELSDWWLRILGTDLCSDALQRARRGRYTQMEVNRGLPVALLIKHFRKEGSEWQLKDEVRKMTDFRQLNLIDTWPPLPCMDIVFLRNVLIYFDVPTKKEILAKVRQVLRPDGYLFLGGAETTLNLDEAFERVDLERAGCYRLKKTQ
jgi:chemotaxis protein methyltransferase CheR